MAGRSKTIGRLGVVVGIDTKPFSKGIKTARLELTKFSKSVSGVGAGISAMVAAAAGFNALKASTSVASGLEQAMSYVKSRTDLTNDAMLRLQNTARELGRTTQFTSTEAAQGMEMIARNGFKSETALKMITKEALNLASVDGLEGGLQKSSDILTKLMRQFNLGFQDASRIADTLTVSASNAATGVGELFRNMEIAGAQARGIGMGLEETAAWQAEISNLRGERRAGTSFRAMLAGITAPTEQARKTLDELRDPTTGKSFSYIDEGTNKTKSLIQIIDDLDKSMEGLAMHEKTDIIADLFEQEGRTTIMAMLGAGTDKIAANLMKIRAAAISPESETLDMATTRLDNLRGSMTRLKSASQNVMESFSLPQLPVLKGIVDRVRQSMQDMSVQVERAGQWVANLIQQVVTGGPGVIATMVRMAGILGGMVATSTALNVAMKMLAFAWQPFSAGIAIARVGMTAMFATTLALSMVSFAPLIVGMNILNKLTKTGGPLAARMFTRMIMGMATVSAHMTSAFVPNMIKGAAAARSGFFGIANSIRALRLPFSLMRAQSSKLFTQLVNLAAIKGLELMASPFRLLTRWSNNSLISLKKLQTAGFAPFAGLLKGLKTKLKTFFAAIGTGIRAVSGGMNMIIGKMFAFTAVLSSVLAPILGIVAAFGVMFLATERGIEGLKAGWASLKENVHAIVAAWQGAFRNIVSLGLTALSEFFGMFGIEWEASIGGMEGGWVNMMNGLGMGITRLGIWVETLTDSWSRVWEFASLGLKAFWELFKANGEIVVGKIANKLIDAFEVAANALAGLLQPIMDSIGRDIGISILQATPEFLGGISDSEAGIMRMALAMENREKSKSALEGIKFDTSSAEAKALTAEQKLAKALDNFSGFMGSMDTDFMKNARRVAVSAGEKKANARRPELVREMQERTDNKVNESIVDWAETKKYEGAELDKQARMLRQQLLAEGYMGIDAELSKVSLDEQSRLGAEFGVETLDMQVQGSIEKAMSGVLERSGVDSAVESSDTGVKEMGKELNKSSEEQVKAIKDAAAATVRAIKGIGPVSVAGFGA